MTFPQSTPGAAWGSLVVEKPDDSASATAPDRTVPAETPKSGTRAEHSSDRFRGDVAGLRAVAVGLVLLYHAGLPFLPGGFVGVDVFFVISGFLITGQLIAEIDRTGRISLPAFWARRAKRILPAATVVLGVTAASVRLFVPRSRWEDVGGDIVSAATYVVNWRFADRAVDYLAEDSPPSPVQHYWSLAVEEQFYLVWPLLIIAAIVVARMIRRKNVRPILWIGLVVVAVPSFAWSIMETANSPERAFFVSTTRMWELSIGAGVALIATRAARIPRTLAAVAGWLGLAAIVTSALLVTSRTAWPGHAAALPTLGAAAVIAAGAAAGTRGPIAILGTRPFRWIGDLSYSLYLWHWPMIAVATVHWNGLSVARGTAVVLASVIPAWITFRLVENPLRYSRAVSRSPRLALSLGGNFTMVGICAGFTLLVMSASAASGPAGLDRRAPGAAVLRLSAGDGQASTVPDRFDFITPDPLRAVKDLPDTTADGCFQQMVSAELVWCAYGNPRGATKVALVGDSKMDQWLPAFQLLAAQNDWSLVVAFKGACPLMSGVALTGDDPTKPYPDCTQWNTTLVRRLVAERPDYVFTSQVSSRAADSSGRASVDAMVEGMRSSWSTLASVGTKVIVIANNPYPGLNVIQCVDKNRQRLSACRFGRERHDEDPAFLTQRQAVAGVTNVKMIDLFDVICPTEKCPPVIGNVLVYRRGSHITATYVKTLTPQLAQALSGVGMQVNYTPTY
jgi:peptidoglycan/LPS O-acetylase OafA/YrhL